MLWLLACLWPAFAAGDTPGTLLYTLNVSTLIGGVDQLFVFAGDDPVLSAYQFCKERNLETVQCDPLMKYLCSKTGLRCRSKQSVLDGNPDARAFHVRAEWDSVCAIRIDISIRDADRASLVNMNKVSDETQNDLLHSLINLHCGNIATFRSSCYCFDYVRNSLYEELSQQLKNYRWSLQSTHYTKLGLDRHATVQDIKRAYRKLSLLFHPDRNPGNPESQEIFLKLQESYTALSSQESRFTYDTLAFGQQYTTKNHLPKVREEVHHMFGNSVSVSVDAHGNIKIVF